MIELFYNFMEGFFSCIKNLSKQQFYYRAEALSTNNTVFQAIPFMANEELTKLVNDIEKIKISIGNANITVMTSETDVISVVVETQPSQC